MFEKKKENISYPEDDWGEEEFREEENEEIKEEPEEEGRGTSDYNEDEWDTVEDFFLEDDNDDIDDDDDIDDFDDEF